MSQSQLVPEQVLFAGQYAPPPQGMTSNAALVPHVPAAGAPPHEPSVVHVRLGQQTAVLPPVPYGQQPLPQSSGAELGQVAAVPHWPVLVQDPSAQHEVPDAQQ